jgi:hypothetical protein
MPEFNKELKKKTITIQDTKPMRIIIFIEWCNRYKREGNYYETKDVRTMA